MNPLDCECVSILNKVLRYVKVLVWMCGWLVVVKKHFEYSVKVEKCYISTSPCLHISLIVSKLGIDLLFPLYFRVSMPVSITAFLNVKRITIIVCINTFKNINATIFSYFIYLFFIFTSTRIGHSCFKGNFLFNSRKTNKIWISRAVQKQSDCPAAALSNCTSHPNFCFFFLALKWKQSFST